VHKSVPKPTAPASFKTTRGFPSYPQASQHTTWWHRLSSLWDAGRDAAPTAGTTCRAPTPPRPSNLSSPVGGTGFPACATDEAPRRPTGLGGSASVGCRGRARGPPLQACATGRCDTANGVGRVPAPRKFGDAGSVGCRAGPRACPFGPPRSLRGLCGRGSRGVQTNRPEFWMPRATLKMGQAPGAWAERGRGTGMVSSGP